MKRQKTRESEMLRKARLAMGYTQMEVAMIAGIPIKAYQRFEYGERDIRSASMKTGLAICAVLGIDPILLTFGGEFNAMAVFRTQ